MSVAILKVLYLGYLKKFTLFILDVGNCISCAIALHCIALQWPGLIFTEDAQKLS
jgi:hypothetical protein